MPKQNGHHNLVVQLDAAAKKRMVPETDSPAELLAAGNRF